jgi:glycosyltransferase involved in cell wall biosynthesis
MAAILAGGGTAAEEIACASADVDRVEVSGRFDYADLPALYTRCDAVYAVYGAVLGNVRTLFPVKVMEAMACALPVVVSAGTWIGEYVEREGIGLAIDGDDPVALSAALIRLKDEPSTAEEMGRRGLAIVEAGLSWQAASARLVEAYRAL